jgi:hypothetical protein
MNSILNVISAPISNSLKCQAALGMLDKAGIKNKKSTRKNDRAVKNGGTHITLRCCVSPCVGIRRKTAIIGSRLVYRGPPKAPCCAQMPYRPRLLSAYNNDLENRRAIFLPVAAEV